MKDFIYKTTNLINNKQYVGKHNSSLDDGYLGSGLILKQAIKKYGNNNFKREIIESCDSSLSKERETYWIKKLDTISPNGYNIRKEGGSGGDVYTNNPKLEKIKRKLSKTWKQKYKDGYINPRIGKPSWNKNKKMSEKYCLANSLSQKKLFKSGYIHPMFNKKHKEISKLKMSNSATEYFYVLISPMNIKYQINNIIDLKDFCRNNNLNYMSLRNSVVKNNLYIGWKVFRYRIKEMI